MQSIPCPERDVYFVVCSRVIQFVGKGELSKLLGLKKKPIKNVLT